VQASTVIATQKTIDSMALRRLEIFMAVRAEFSDHSTIEQSTTNISHAIRHSHPM